MTSFRLIFSIAMISSTANGFMNLASTFTVAKQASKPALQEFAKIQENMLLNIQLDIYARTNDEAHLPLSGLSVELHQEEITGDHRPSMPGADGPHADLSTGVHNIDIKNDASFVGMNGMNYAQLKNGCWEMTWREGDPSGALVCGFDVPDELKRNSNSVPLPSGRIYMSFRLWNDKGLKEMRSKLEEAELEAKEHLKKRQQELEKMQQTKNPIMKFLHRGNSFNALDKYVATGAQDLEKGVPSDDKLLTLDGGLRLRMDGHVFLASEKGPHALIGKVHVNPGLGP
mmetsp:Transcript_25288/g.35470  ORF Transcript_25288/g.35470 Transcript_25288/m.35470 type:complete len:286 (-) Transcript_25288:185-1042(-)